jgi:hypothetical protein
MSSFQFTTVNDLLLEECAAFEYILLGDLRDLLEEPTDEMACKWLLAVLGALLQTLPRDFQLQDEGGYLAEVVEEFPNWSVQVNRLLQERETLFSNLNQLRERITQEIPFAEIAEKLRHDLHGWMASYVAFQRHERRLVQTAFNLDVGVGD